MISECGQVDARRRDAERPESPGPRQRERESARKPPEYTERVVRKMCANVTVYTPPDKILTTTRFLRTEQTYNERLGWVTGVLRAGVGDRGAGDKGQLAPRRSEQVGDPRQNDFARVSSPPEPIDRYQPTREPIGRVVNKVNAPRGTPQCAQVRRQVADLGISAAVRSRGRGRPIFR